MITLNTFDAAAVALKILHLSLHPAKGCHGRYYRILLLLGTWDPKN